MHILYIDCIQLCWKFKCDEWWSITGQQKNFFQKSLNVKMILGYIKVAELKYALSFEI